MSRHHGGSKFAGYGLEDREPHQAGKPAGMVCTEIYAPAPWSAEGEHVYHRDGGHVGLSEPIRTDRDAIARLFAASPLLYSAAKRAAEVLTNLHGSFGGINTEFDQDHADAVDIATAELLEAIEAANLK